MDYISRKSYVCLALKAAIIDLKLDKQQPVLEYLLVNLISQTIKDKSTELTSTLPPKELNISMDAMQTLENEYPLKGGEDDMGNILKYRATIYDLKLTRSYDSLLKMGSNRIALFEGYTDQNYTQK